MQTVVQNGMYKREKGTCKMASVLKIDWKFNHLPIVIQESFIEDDVSYMTRRVRNCIVPRYPVTGRRTTLFPYFSFRKLQKDFAKSINVTFDLLSAFMLYVYVKKYGRNGDNCPLISFSNWPWPQQPCDPGRSRPKILGQPGPPGLPVFPALQPPPRSQQKHHRGGERLPFLQPSPQDLG